MRLTTLLSLLVISTLISAAPAPAPTISPNSTITKLHRRDSSSTSIDLGSWTTSIKSVTTKDPTTKAADVYDTMYTNLWDLWWYDDNDNWRDGCNNNNTPVLWPVAVAGKAITDKEDSSKVDDVTGAIAKYKSKSTDGGYSASTNKDDDIYTDDDAQALWVLVDAFKIKTSYDEWESASDLMSFLKSEKNSKQGGITWSINGDYIASISTLETGLAAARLYSMKYQSDLLTLAKYCINWTLSNLLDSDDKFIYDGMNEDGSINNGKLTYTIGVAISTLCYLDKYDNFTDNADWKSMAVELAARFIGGGQLNTQFYTDGYINDQIRYSHLLFAGFADLLEMTDPLGDYENDVYDAIKNEVVREGRNLFDTYEDNNININGTCPSVNTDLLDYASLTQIFYQVSRVTTEF